MEEGAALPSPTRWQAAVEQRARWAGQDGKRLCLLGFAGEVELWDLEADRLLARAAGPFVEVRPLPHGCATRSDIGAELLADDGRTSGFAVERVSALGVDGANVLIAAGGAVHLFGTDPSSPLRSIAAGEGVAALARIGSVLAVGYRDGHVEVLPMEPASNEPHVSFQQVPSSRPLRIVAGPMGTVAAGYANGFVGLWSLRDGALLASSHLHGRVVHLRIDGRRLHAATDLGGVLTWDLSALHQPYCELLREVWQRVPIVWDGGRPVRRDAPAQHPCNAPNPE